MNLVKKFFCLVGWHSFSYEDATNEHFNRKFRCKWCKSVGLVDSQGNLFNTKNYDIHANRIDDNGNRI